jgi:hypothetical protein
MIKRDNKKAQVTIFVIIAIVILAGVIGYLVFRNNSSGISVPASLEPVYNNFLNCLEEDVLIGIDVLESQGGYIELPEFEPGSDYMPFSSQLDFLGNPIPYWYYVSGNNIQREQVPTKSEMEESLEDFLEEKIRDCSYEVYYDSGFEVIQNSGEAEVKIEEDKVFVDLDMDLSISRANDSVLVGRHRVEVDSNIGGLYDSALKIYEQEQETLFLENYAVDTLRLYAPVDGVELTCSPKVWNAEEVFSELKGAIETNTLALRNEEGDFELKDKKSKYFVLDLGVNKNVRFLNSQNWPYSFEVAPSEDVVMISNPVGNQLGLGVLGFCYVPYHFVYNIKYPVLVQVYSDYSEEIFQFPMAVVLLGNRPREPLDGGIEEEAPRDFCQDKNTLMQINTYDKSLNSVDAEISYSCFGEVCRIGETENGVLESNFPQCVNGFVIASSEGFLDSKVIASSVTSSSVDVILDRVYDREVLLRLDGRAYDGEAIINFVSNKTSQTIIYPEQKNVELVEGQYEVTVHIYRESDLRIEGVNKQQCYETPSSGLGGLFGATEENCVDLEIPDQIVSNALAGGGIQSHYILEDTLASSSLIEINARSLPNPESLEDLQENYVFFEEQNLGINIK